MKRYYCVQFCHKKEGWVDLPLASTSQKEAKDLMQEFSNAHPFAALRVLRKPKGWESPPEVKEDRKWSERMDIKGFYISAATKEEGVRYILLTNLTDAHYVQKTELAPRQVKVLETKDAEQWKDLERVGKVRIERAHRVPYFEELIISATELMRKMGAFNGGDLRTRLREFLNSSLDHFLPLASADTKPLPWPIETDEEVLVLADAVAEGDASALSLMATLPLDKFDSTTWLTLWHNVPLVHEDTEYLKNNWLKYYSLEDKVVLEAKASIVYPLPFVGPYPLWLSREQETWFVVDGEYFKEFDY